MGLEGALKDEDRDIFMDRVGSSGSEAAGDTGSSLANDLLSD